MLAVDALRRYEAKAGPKPAAIARRYLEWRGQPTEHSLKAYLEELGRQGLASGTIDLHYRTIRAFYRHLGYRAPEVRGWRYDPEDSHRPALSADLVRRLIGAARADLLSPRQAALLALSTTHGPRAVEMARVRNGDVDHVGQRVYIRTAKGGQPRWCWLPLALHPYVPEQWPEECSANSVEQTWHNLLDSAGVTVPPRTAWHSIRRALVRDLDASGVPQVDIGVFMRWAKGGAGAGAARMVEWYSNPSDEVQADGTASRARTQDAGTREYDGAVWASHPFLPYWS